MTTLPRMGEWTGEDLWSLLDDGNRYEILDGSLLVTPSPSAAHQNAGFAIARALANACPNDLRVMMAPFDVLLGVGTVLQPDVLVARRTDLTEKNLPAAPVLIVEVLSRSTAVVDRGLKFAAYQRAGVVSYWIVDPDPVSARLTVWRLGTPNGPGGDSSYELVADLVGEETWTATHPFEVSLTPARLVD